MKKTFELKTPLHSLLGEAISVLTLDFDQIKTRDYATMCQIERRLRGDGELVAEVQLAKATSIEFRMAASWVAALKGTKGLMLDMIDDLAMPDLLRLANESLSFLAGLE